MRAGQGNPSDPTKQGSARICREDAEIIPGTIGAGMGNLQELPGGCGKAHTRPCQFGEGGLLLFSLPNPGQVPLLSEADLEPLWQGMQGTDDPRVLPWKQRNVQN